MSDRRRLTWYAIARMIVVTLFYASTAILYERRPDSFESISLPGLWKLIGATYLFSLFSLAALSLQERVRPILIYTQVIWDLLLVTLLVLLTGGISSPYSFLYMLAIISASTLLSRREAFYAASLCAILYGSIIDLQFYGKLISIGLSSNSAQQYGLPYLLYTVFLNITAFYLTALLTGYLAERVKASENALLEKEIDYLELERLNSSIVKNLTSGLMTVTPDGKVRVFNRFAEELTGISQEKAYDRPLGELIPGFEPVLSKEDTVVSGEAFFHDPAGEEMIFGFRAIRFFDNKGEFSGIIINFEDLSRIRRMEEELKRADRLAAIGELSARIAHEIRNPLASISGSVQLMAQADEIPEKDRKLLAIVLRETDRLNALISDFLVYARPVSLNRQNVLLRELFVQLDALLKPDPRFLPVTMNISAEDGVTVLADRDQLQQVFWNLLVNAAEAMPAGGEISVEGSRVHLSGSRSEQKDLVRIDVTDTGTGMAAAATKHLFEPFFTTKPDGTGLGLATVYRIIAAHDGKIFVESLPGKGTKFSILLPAGEIGEE
ncbi:signal transduction histidine-protein kinase AtoS [Geobacter sp. OR-1]|uniref:two-component system sensor histidine kinase NtrB n=1 Tax=Geobacter sp. OR-1 TaxID=1266765 RepID=UPI00054357AE|nr:ATP-binding protein [Geobacter sp. OR-1]GAM11516.1 signal transduction histidine-protein kinase AtoS [Geobacter sp. OR-1]